MTKKPKKWGRVTKRTKADPNAALVKEAAKAAVEFPAICGLCGGPARTDGTCAGDIVHPEDKQKRTYCQLATLGISPEIDEDAAADDVECE